MAPNGGSTGDKTGWQSPPADVRREAAKIRSAYTPKERAADADHYAASILPRTLAHDSAFRVRVDRVRAAAHTARARGRRDPIQADIAAERARARAAFREAHVYFRSGCGRRVIATLLERASQIDLPASLSRRGSQVELRLTNRLAPAVWSDAPLAEDDRQRWLRTDLIATLISGADRIARRGHHYCLECGAGLPRSAHDYCTTHENKPWLQSRNEEQMLAAVHATAKALSPPNEQP